MNKPILTKGSSLLERAAEVYDFSAHRIARDIPESELQPAPVPATAPAQPVAEAPKSAPVAPKPVAAAPVPASVESPTVAVAKPVPLPVAGRQARIDRDLLADNQ